MKTATGRIPAGTILPYRRQYYCESLDRGLAPPRSASVGNAPIGLVGREVANQQWLNGLLRYGREPSLGFLLHDPADRAPLEQTLDRVLPAAKTVRMGPIANAERWLDGGPTRIVWEPQPPSSRWAWLRHRIGGEPFAMCGITHALCSPAAVMAIRDLVQSPIRPYDRLVCTSEAVATTARALMKHWSHNQRQLSAMRSGHHSVIENESTESDDPIRLEIIPLGVNTEHHRPATTAIQANARRKMGIAADSDVVLFVGRLSHHAKSNPLPLFAACQSAATRIATREPSDGDPPRKITLVMAGWFASDTVHRAFGAEAARVAPDVSVKFIDATKPDHRDAVWDVADVFVSLADSIQETFGLTVVEAMSRGIPVIASDWNGYRETVIDGVTGRLIPTTMVRGISDDAVDAMMRGDLSYDHFLAQVGQGVGINLTATENALIELLDDPDRRRSMGEAARKHVIANYAWPKIIARYEDLWKQQRMQVSRFRDSQDTLRSNVTTSFSSARPNPAPSQDVAQPIVPSKPNICPNASFDDMFADYPSCWLDGDAQLSVGNLRLGSAIELESSPLANHSRQARLAIETWQAADSFGVLKPERVDPSHRSTLQQLALQLADRSAPVAARLSSRLAEQSIAWAIKFDLLTPTLEAYSNSKTIADPASVPRDPATPAIPITFVTTCMGRLEHLKQTLPLMANQPGCRVVVVDYACPDHCGDWVSENYDAAIVSVVRITDRDRFDRSEAKNAGIIASQTDWVCLVDADVTLQPDFADHLRQRIRPGRFIRSSSILEGTGGTFAAQRQALIDSGMHDPVYQGWGEEDDDLLDALQFHGIRGDVYEDRFVHHLDHDDDLRTQFHDDGDRRVSHMINRIYRSVKWDLSRLSGTVPARSNREQIFKQVDTQVRYLLENEKDVLVVIDTGAMNWVPLAVKCRRELTYRIIPDDLARPGQYVKQSDKP